MGVGTGIWGSPGQRLSSVSFPSAALAVTHRLVSGVFAMMGKHVERYAFSLMRAPCGWAGRGWGEAGSRGNSILSYLFGDLGRPVVREWAPCGSRVLSPDVPHSPSLLPIPGKIR